MSKNLDQIFQVGFSYENEKLCGEYRSRTDDLLRARQAL